MIILLGLKFSILLHDLPSTDLPLHTFCWVISFCLTLQGSRILHREVVRRTYGRLHTVLFEDCAGALLSWYSLVVRY